MRDKVIQKLEKYQAMKQEIENYDYMADVENEVAKVRANLIKVAESDKLAKLAKIDIYIELLDSLLEEDKEEETTTNENISEEISNEISEPVDEINEEV